MMTSVAKGAEEDVESRSASKVRLPSPVGPPSLLDVAQYAVTFPGGKATEAETDLYAKRAAEVLKREGFVIVLDAISPEAVSAVLKCCRDVEAEILDHDPDLIGCRDPGRYSFSSVLQSGGMLHCAAWGHLLDCKAVMAVLDASLPEGWLVYGGGGDFVRGGTENFQGLHSDVSVRSVMPELRTYWPAPSLSVNFTVQQIDSASFGPLRVIPRRKLVNGVSEDHPPLHLDEEQSMRRSTLFPLPPGAAILRDHRLWHSGSPNLTGQTRFLPSIEVCSQAYADRSRWRDWRPLLCPDVFSALSERSQARCKFIVAAQSSDIAKGIKEDFHCVQATYMKGAGRSWQNAWWPASYSGNE